MQSHGAAASVTSILTQLADFLDEAGPNDLALKQLVADGKDALDDWGAQCAAQEWDGLAGSVERFRQQVAKAGVRMENMKRVLRLDELLRALRSSALAAAAEASQSD